MARKVYTREFRESAVRLASQRNASMEKIANELGIACWTLRRWVRADRPASEAPAPKQPDLQQRVRQLEAENKQLRMERDILRKATAFFARAGGPTTP